MYDGKHDTFLRSSSWRKTWNSDFYLESPTSFNQQNISDSTAHIYSHSRNWATDSQNRQIILKWHCIIWRNDFLGPQMTSKWRCTVTNEVRVLPLLSTHVHHLSCLYVLSHPIPQQHDMTAQSMNWSNPFVMSWFTSLGLHPSETTVFTSLNHPVWYTAGLNSLVIF